MTSIGFLACKTTLPTLDPSGVRRGDAFEHDLMIAALEPAFAALDLSLRVVDWEAPIEEFADIDLVMLGTAWDYQDKPQEFLGKLEALEQRGVIVCNSSAVVRWNATKTYLRELAERGVRTIPTLWREVVTRKAALEAMDAFGTDRIVVKRQIGAGALGQELLSRGSLPDDTWEFGHPAMLQPFMPAIAEDGELSFIFIDGALSHTLRKRPAKGDYRIQSLYGGQEEIFTPSAKETAAARAIIDALPFETPLYARIDMLRGDGRGGGSNCSVGGDLMVMEAELIEPYLYPEQGPDLGPRMARAVAERVSKL